MKKIILLLSVLFSNCSKPCECFNYAEPLRLVILNSQKENLLEPNKPNSLMIDKLTLALGININYVIKDYIIPSQATKRFFHLESIDDNYFKSSIGKEGTFYITYKNSSDIDTMKVLIEEQHSKVSGCNCTSFPYTYIKHNNKTITEFDLENSTGSAIIIK